MQHPTIENIFKRVRSGQAWKTKVNKEKMCVEIKYVGDVRNVIK